MSIRGSAFSTPWLRFHGGGAADVYIIIRVRANRCGESALNPPPSQHIPRRRPAPAPAQRRALPEHFLTPFPSTSAPPRSADAHPQAAPCIPRRPHNTFPVEDLLPPPHSDAPCPCPPATSHAAPMHTRRPHNPFPAKSLRPSPHSDTPVPAAPPCLPFCSTSGTKKRHRTVDVRCRMSRSTVVAVGHWGW